MRQGRHIILNFHGIGTPHDRVDASERPYWIGEDMFRAIVDRVSARPDADSVRWTFDDGNRSDLVVGARVLAEREKSGAFFLLTGRFDDPHYVSCDDARALVSMGMEVGLHGRDHVDWRQVPRWQLDSETVEARDLLADVVGQPINGVAIPFGAYNRTVIAHLKDCGFDHIYTSDGGSCHPDDRIVNRTSVREDMSLAHIDAILDDDVPIKRRVKRRISTTLRRHFL